MDKIYGYKFKQHTCELNRHDVHANFSDLLTGSKLFCVAKCHLVARGDRFAWKQIQLMSMHVIQIQWHDFFSKIHVDGLALRCQETTTKKKNKVIGLDFRLQQAKHCPRSLVVPCPGDSITQSQNSSLRLSWSRWAPSGECCGYRGSCRCFWWYLHQRDCNPHPGTWGTWFSPLRRFPMWWPRGTWGKYGRPAGQSPQIHQWEAQSCPG